MNHAKWIVGLGLALGLAGGARADHPASQMLEEAIESNAGLITLPSSVSGSLAVRDCAACASHSLRLSANVRFFIAGRPATLQELDCSPAVEPACRGHDLLQHQRRPRQSRDGGPLRPGPGGQSHGQTDIPNQRPGVGCAVPAGGGRRCPCRRHRDLLRQHHGQHAGEHHADPGHLGQHGQPGERPGGLRLARPRIPAVAATATTTSLLFPNNGTATPPDCSNATARIPMARFACSGRGSRRSAAAPALRATTPTRTAA